MFLETKDWYYFNREVETPQQNIRVFFSFHVPDDIGVRLLSDLGDQAGLTRYPIENLHMTLKFVGEVNPDELQKLIELGETLAEHARPISVTGKRFVVADERLRLELAPNRTLSKMYGECIDQLKKHAIGKIETRAFTPHVTLGRPTAEFQVDKISADPGQFQFTADSLGFYKSEPGEHGMGRYTLLQAFGLRGEIEQAREIENIILPTRPQPDTIVAIFLLKEFGEDVYPGIRNAVVDSWQVVPEGKDADQLLREGVLLLDIGGGRFDHHDRAEKTTASDLVSEGLGIKDDPAIAKLLEYARRDDFYGKGTISNDQLDRAFGLSGLVAALNKTYVGEVARVVEITLPLVEAHYREEVRRTKELPEEFEAKKKAGEVDAFSVKQRDKKLSVAVVTSDNASLPGYLRSQQGGRFDVVAQWLSSGHVNILTRPTKRVDLRSLTLLLRMEEATRAGIELQMEPKDLAKPGRLNEIPEWYFDPATNSIQNGGLNPTEVKPTRISRADFNKIIELGLSEQLWKP